MPSNRSCRMSIMAYDVWHVAPSCWNHMLSVFISILGHKKLLSSICSAVDDYGNARFVLEEIRTDDSARPKSASNFLGMHLELVYLAWISIVWALNKHHELFSTPNMFNMYLYFHNNKYKFLQYIVFMYLRIVRIIKSQPFHVNLVTPLA